MEINSFEGWSKLTLADITSKVEGEYNSLRDLLLAFYMENNLKDIKLYLQDRATFVQPKIIDFRDKSKFMLYIKSFIPLKNPTSNIKEYQCIDKCITTRGFMPALVVSRLDELPYAKISDAIMQNIVNDYLNYNKGYTLLDYLKIKAKYIYYLHKNSNSFVLTSLTTPYNQIIDKISTLSEGVIYSLQEQGVYYLDRSGGRDALMFATPECVDVFGDFYFITKYYRIDSDNTKTLVPANELTLILDTMQLAVLFKTTFPKSKHTSSITAFDANAVKTFVRGEYEKGNYDVYIERSIRLYSPNYQDGNVRYVGSINVNAMKITEDSSDFVLVLLLNAHESYNRSSLTKYILNLDVICMFKSMVNACSYHNCNVRTLYNYFNSKINFIKYNGDPQVIRCALREDNPGIKTIAVNILSHNRISVWIRSGTADRYFQTVFSFNEDDTDRVTITCHENKISPTDKGLITLSSSSCEQNSISLSLVDYIVNGMLIQTR